MEHHSMDAGLVQAGRLGAENRQVFNDMVQYRRYGGDLQG